MSLINDALKRAKEAQQDKPPASAANLQFRPIDPAQSGSKGTRLVLPGILIIALVAAGFWYWHLNQIKAAAAPLKQIATAPEPSPAPSQSLLSMAPPKPQPAPVEANVAAKQEEVPATNAVASAPPPPKTAPPKLQAILFDTVRPSAIISGKTVFVKGKIGEYQVSAITPKQVTLVSETETNVLKFDE